VQESAVQFRGKRSKCQIKIEKWKIGARWTLGSQDSIGIAAQAIFHDLRVSGAKAPK
jgi:hypothetical protein